MMFEKEPSAGTPVGDALCHERHGKIDAAMERYLERIEQLEVCTVKLTQVIERYDAQLAAHESRIYGLEQKPAQNTARLVWYAVCALMGAVAAVLAEYLTV